MCHCSNHVVAQGHFQGPLPVLSRAFSELMNLVIFLPRLSLRNVPHHDPSTPLLTSDPPLFHALDPFHAHVQLIPDHCLVVNGWCCVYCMRNTLVSHVSEGIDVAPWHSSLTHKTWCTFFDGVTLLAFPARPLTPLLALAVLDCLDERRIDSATLLDLATCAWCQR